MKHHSDTSARYPAWWLGAGAAGLCIALAVVAIHGREAAPMAGVTPLDEDEIRAALIGRTVEYAPPGSGDMGVEEAFATEGQWHGIQYGLAPFPFTGRWWIKNGQLCVAQRTGHVPLEGERCRTVWRDAKTGALFMDYLYRDRPKGGTQRLNVKSTPET